MESGLSCTYPLTVYPRVNYLKKRLQRLIPRWQNILGEGRLPECISEGKVKLENILAEAGRVTGENTTVNLFGDDDDVIKTLELTVRTKSGLVEEKDKLTWINFVHWKGKKYDSSVTVIVISSLEEMVVKSLEGKLSTLSDSQLVDVIIYNKKNKTNFRYMDLIKANFKQEDIDLSDSSVQDRSRFLNQQIQHVLEEKVVSVLDQIAAYDKVFVPKKQEDIEDSLQNAVHMELLKSLKDPFAVKDLSPDNKKEEAERKPTDKELAKIAAAIGSNWEMLGPALGIPGAKMKEIKCSSQSVQSQIYHMLLIWHQRDKATLKYLIQVLENTSSKVSVDIAVINEFKVDVLTPTTDSERDVVFHRKLTDFVAKKTKCVTCDKLSLKYGISSALINEFMNDGLFGYEMKVKEMMENMSLPSWPRDKSDNGVSACRTFSHKCRYPMSKITSETEDFVQAKHDMLMLVKKLQFELFGLLEQADVTIETKIPVIPKLPVPLQQALLAIEEVYGCGTVCGDLELHVTKQLLPASKDKVKQLLLDYKYLSGYTIQLISPPNHHVGGNIDQRNRIRAMKLPADSDEYQCGSIGCFVKIKSNKADASNPPIPDKTLHCITCAHCVLECHNIVDVKISDSFEVLGTVQFKMYKPESIDIAAIEIHTDKVTSCETTLMEPDEKSIQRHKWSFYDGMPLGRTVYKYGCATVLTHGLLTSNDYATKQMMENWNRVSKYKYNFNVEYNMLIGPLPDFPHLQGIHVDQPDEDQQMDTKREFSAKGDSGSVVCDADISTGEIIVLALLCGDVRNEDEKFLYSYASQIKKVVTALEKEFECCIEPGI